MSVAAEGFTSSVLLVRLRWRMVRSRLARALIVVGGFFLLLAFCSIINFGFVVNAAAQLGDGSSANTFAMSWIESLLDGGLGLGALFVGGAILVSFFAPVTGAATTSFVAEDDLLGVRFPRSHRFFDALFVNMFSGVGLMQLFALTSVSSVILFSGQRVWGFLVTWALWFVLVAVMTLVGFALEWVNRRFGVRQRWLGAIVFALFVALVVFVDSLHGGRLFGLANWYSSVLTLSADGFSWASVAAVAALLLTFIVVVGLGLKMSLLALALPSRVKNGVRERRSGMVARSVGTISLLLLTRALWRTRECRRPVLILVGLGVPAVMFTNFSQSFLVALPLTVPLGVSLAWGVNIFGVLGSGMKWLSSQPKIMQRLPTSAVFLQLAVTIGVIMGLWGISFSLGRASLGQGWVLLCATVVVSLLTSAISIVLSVVWPRRAPLSGIGDSLVPPVVALAYLGLLLTVGCLPGIALTQVNDWVVRYSIVGVSTVISVCVFVWVRQRWSDPVVRARAVDAVSSF